MWLSAFFALVAAYLIGSIPAGYLAGRIAGIDIRHHGSGNIGATNVMRTLGKKFGLGVFFFDAFKGFVAVRLAIFIAERFEVMRPYADLLGVAAAACCILGHTFPVWLKFKGGKGVATSAGAFAGLTPLASLAAFLLWILLFETTRYVSLASVAAAISLPIWIGVLLQVGLAKTWLVFYVACVLAVIVVWRHRANIVRLKNGTEPRFERK